MAHYAKLGINSKVIAVHVVADKDCQNADGIEDEEVGRQFLENIHNWPLWKKTSYNTFNNKHKSGDDSKAFRGNYAGIGYTYDEDNDIFIPKKPYASWILNTAEARWQSPIGDEPQLTEEQEAQNTPADEDTPPTHRWFYVWNETDQTWDLENQLA
tara:strand:+ start:64 stop:531 length:468 start_codon:yes stop_codon:yes gene_type:complete